MLWNQENEIRVIQRRLGLQLPVVEIFSNDPRLLDLRPETGGGQHGMCFDDTGRKFLCSNSDHLQIARYEDRYGAIIDRPGHGYVELRWYDATSDMTREEFCNWLARFAEEVGTNRRTGVLIDATRFRTDRENMDGAWRDEHIIPRYNAAGVERFAFLMPDGMPAIGNAPAPEGPATFPTAYFGKREAALAWLSATLGA